MPSSTRASLSPGKALPTPARLSERSPGLSPVLSIDSTFTLSPLAGFSPALSHAGLRSLKRQIEGISLSPLFRGLERHGIESPDYSPNSSSGIPTRADEIAFPAPVDVHARHSFDWSEWDIPWRRTTSRFSRAYISRLPQCEMENNAKARRRN